MKLRYRGYGYTHGRKATAHKNPFGQWFVKWENGRESESGVSSGVEDAGVHACWDVLDQDLPKEEDNTTPLKERNMAPKATVCCKCGGKLREPYPGLKHCPVCEP